MVCLPERERLPGPNKRIMITAPIQTKALTIAAMLGSVAETTALYVPCHSATIKMLPWVLLSLA